MRAQLEETFYNVTVTPEELWRAVGRTLERARLDRKWRPMDVERAGGPSYKTVQSIEAGDVGRVENLNRCARALDLSIVDILHAILAATVTPLSPEAAQVVRTFVETTVDGRTAMLALSRALPRVGGSMGPELLPGVGAPGAPPRPRPVPPAPKRRTAR